MTPTPEPRKRRRMPPPAPVKRKRRLRTYPKQAYLSLDELEALEQLLDAKGCTFSELVRRWILREQTRQARRQQQQATQHTPPHDDPRQLAIEGARR